MNTLELRRLADNDGVNDPVKCTRTYDDFLKRSTSDFDRRRRRRPEGELAKCRALALALNKYSESTGLSFDAVLKALGGADKPSATSWTKFYDRVLEALKLRFRWKDVANTTAAKTNADKRHATQAVIALVRESAQTVLTELESLGAIAKEHAEKHRQEVATRTCDLSHAGEKLRGQRRRRVDGERKLTVYVFA